MLYNLTYILAFDACDEPLSVTKHESFESLELAQDRADELDACYFEQDCYSISNFTINGERFIPIMERIYLDKIAEQEAGEDYYLHPSTDGHPDSRDEMERLYWEEYMKDCEADTAINLAKDKQALQDDDYLPF